MNDNEAFEKWFNSDLQDLPEIHDAYERHIWQAACGWKDKSILNGTRMRQMNEEIEKLQAENIKLKQLLEKATVVIKRCEFGLQPEFYGGKDNGSLKDCRDFLKKWVGI